MAEVEEPQFTSLSARIAALNQQGVGKSLNVQHAPTGRKPPPPIPASKNRPSLNSRGQTTNNPPISTYGSANQTQSNQPISSKLQLLPPPPIDRDQIKINGARTPPLPARNGPPPLPGRKASQGLSPALPPRRTSNQLTRKASNESTLSFSSTISGYSLAPTISSATSASSVDTQRRLSAPAFGESKLPPLPPTRRDVEEKAKKEAERVAEREWEKNLQVAERTPLVSTKSAPVLPLRQFPVRQSPTIERDQPPKMPPRPNGAPRLPSRGGNTHNAEEEAPPVQPPRRIPPSSAARSALTMGFGTSGSMQRPNPAPRPAPVPRYTEAEEEDVAPPQPPRRLLPPEASRLASSLGFGNKQTPNPAPRPTPAPIYTTPAASSIQELTARNFDSTIEGKFVLVDFYATYCKYCVELEPIFKRLAEDFAFASDKLIFAKVDVDAQPSLKEKYNIQGYPTIMLFDPSSSEPEKYQYQRKRGAMTDFLEEKTGINVLDGAQYAKSNNVQANPQPNDVPPPINSSSKPSFSQVKAIHPKPVVDAGPRSDCWLCRDWSGPDGVAAQYPRQTLPRGGDQTAYLAKVLCESFSSLTEKARAIFVWLHHNIEYDTKAFFNKNVKHMEPQDTINAGLAVCAGYAGLFAAIALKAGLEAVVVGGNGKGFGYTPMKPGDPIPPRDPTGHAWNACLIDNGEWKLMDACWGAGNVSDKGDQKYNKVFAPEHFIQTNEEFGQKHFPEDDRYFFLPGGRIPTWEEYMIGTSFAGEPVQTFSNLPNHGISKSSFSPDLKQISTRNPNEVVRFQFSKICEHWDHERHGEGKPYCMIVKIWGVDGRKQDFVAMERNDFWWWADIKTRDLGAPGQVVSVYAVTKINDRDVRGLSSEGYLERKGKPGSMGFGGIANWELV